VTQPDAIQPCKGATNIKVMAIGSHGWMEIHPVSKITVIK
jgi:hypothetical protein